MKYDHIYTNFTSGELSPLMMGRSDVQKYANGAKSILNYQIRTQGGCTRRSGGIVQALCKDLDHKVRLHTFEASETAGYVLEFGHLYVRIWTSETTYVDVVTPYTESVIHYLSFDQSADVLFICHKDHKPRTLSRYSDTTWVLATYETEDGPYAVKRKEQEGISITLSNVSDTSELTSSASLFTTVGDYVQFPDDQGRWILCQVASVTSGLAATANRVNNAVEDVTYESFIRSSTASAGTITPVASLTISGTTVTSSVSDVFSRYDVGKYVRAANSGTFGWYLIEEHLTNYTVKVNATPVTLHAYTYPTIKVTEKTRTITGTITASSALFVSTDVGRHVRLDFSAAITWGKITSVTSSTVATVKLEKTVPLDPNDPTKVPNGGTATDWKLGAFSETTGWPRCVALHQQRLFFAGTTSEPQSLWTSELDDYISFATTEDNSEVLDTSGISVTLYSGRSNTIVWMSSGPTLLIGTMSSEWQMRPSSTANETITPTNFSLTRQSKVGSKYGLPGIVVGSSTALIQRSGSRLWMMAYDYSIDAFDGTDVTIISDHILAQGGGVVQFAHQKEPYSIIWCVLANGTLATLTYDKKQEVYAWSRHEMAGADAFVESVAVTPPVDSRGERVYFVVRRTVAGNPVRTLERMDYLEGIQMDGAKQFTATASPGGLYWMEGETATVMSNGEIIGHYEVVGYTITLPESYENVVVGYDYTSKVTPVPGDTTSATGTTVGRLRRAHQASVRVLNTRTLDYWESSGDVIRQDLTYLDDSTGIHTFNPGLANDSEGTFSVGQTLPYPSTLLSIVANTTVGSLV